jgi:hypothetical protein
VGLQAAMSIGSSSELTAAFSNATTSLMLIWYSLAIVFIVRSVGSSSLRGVIGLGERPDIQMRLRKLD